MKAQFIGKVMQLGGIAALGTGAVLSLHHIPAAVAIVGGGVAYYVGQKLQGK
jgi:hypothetical protein